MNAQQLSCETDNVTETQVAHNTAFTLMTSGGTQAKKDTKNEG
jgi:hypothetical protein